MITNVEIFLNLDAPLEYRSFVGGIRSISKDDRSGEARQHRSMILMIRARLEKAYFSLFSTSFELRLIASRHGGVPKYGAAGCEVRSDEDGLEGYPCEMWSPSKSK